VADVPHITEGALVNPLLKSVSVFLLGQQAGPLTNERVKNKQNRKTRSEQTSRQSE